MAQPFDVRVDDALRSLGCAVTPDSPGRWQLAMANGAVMPVRASLSSGWLDLTAALPATSRQRCDDVSALRLNVDLPGSSRVARLFGDRHPHLHADVHVRHVEDLAGWVKTACSSFSELAHHLADGHECETGAPPVSNDADAGDHVELDTRAGVFGARLVDGTSGSRAFVVDLLDLEGRSETCVRAVAALLLAASASLRSVKGGLVNRRIGGATAILVAPLCGPLCGPPDQSADEALSALAAACRFTGREVQALLDEHLAAAYLARSVGPDHEHAHASINQQEEHTCLQ